MKKRSHHPFIFLFIVLIVVLSGIFLILFSRIKQDKQYNELLSLGDKYLQELNYEDAAIAFQNAIEISEREQTAYLRLAETYTAAQDYNRAADVLVAGYDTADDNTLIQSRMIAVYSLVLLPARNRFIKGSRRMFRIPPRKNLRLPSLPRLLPHRRRPRLSLQKHKSPRQKQILMEVSPRNSWIP